MGVGVSAEEVRGDGMLEEGVPQHLQPLQVEAVAGIGERERLQDEPRVGAQGFRGLLRSRLTARGRRRCCGAAGSQGRGRGQGRRCGDGGGLGGGDGGAAI